MKTFKVSVDDYLKVMNGDTYVPATTQKVFTQTQHNAIMNPTPILEDPRAFITFEAKAKVLKAKIKSTIQSKLIELPYDLRKLIESRCVLSGSSISSLYHDEVPKDYDLWTRNFNDTFVIEDAIKREHEYIAEYSDKYAELASYPNGKKLITKNAITLTNGMQFIILGDYEACRKGFDLKHCLPYYVLSTDTFVISPHQMDLIVKKRLEKTKPDLIVKEHRISKFVSRGWSF